MSSRPLTIRLLSVEKEALRELAGQERRRTEAQAAWLICRELERRGLLPTERESLLEAKIQPNAGNNGGNRAKTD